MIKLIREFVSAAKSGGHSGKGNKYYRKGNYEKALHHYELAAQYNEKSFATHNPALLEYLAMTHAQLGNMNEALRVAEQSRNLYSELDSQKQIVADGIARINYFIGLLQSENKEAIRKYIK